MMVSVAKSFTCNPCGKVFASKFKLKSHLIKIKTRTKSFQCETCLLEFSNQKTLDLHASFHNQIIATPKIFKCKLCARTFTKSNALDEHMDAHKNRIGFRCEKCLMVYVDKRKLKLHETNKHKKKCSFYCDHCMCIFTGENPLEKHIQKVHIGSDPQGCKKCSNYTEEDYLRQLQDFC